MKFLVYGSSLLLLGIFCFPVLPIALSLIVLGAIWETQLLAAWKSYFNSANRLTVERLFSERTWPSVMSKLPVRPEAFAVFPTTERQVNTRLGSSENRD